MALAKTSRTLRAAPRHAGRDGLGKHGRPMHAHHSEQLESAPPPGLRERKKAKLRQQIIDTAIRLFRKNGYENTRVEDIVQVLEISQPTFFRYFP
ncbi:MAG TPA: helix-turn-helix domain-containing protein, partial [Terriglobales bacterium]|nr:helix-turn-helix domain-containing protein [Terriglobales bacterium]